MCLIVIAWQVHPRDAVVLAANRDEWRDRPAAPAHWWPDAPAILGGRDLRAGGTWLGANRNGRFAAVTNFRDPAARREAPRSRGELVTRFVQGDESPRAYLDAVASQAHHYQGFNLLAGDHETLGYFGNRDGTVRLLDPGVHALSNHLLNTPWPKVTRAREGLLEALGEDDEALFRLLSETSLAPDESLPDTGVGLDRERMLSPILITGEHYGTRASTVLRLGSAGGRFEERTRDAAGRVVGTAAFDLPAA